MTPETPPTGTTSTTAPEALEATPEPMSAPAPAAPAAAAQSTSKGARSYLVMMVLAVFLFPTGLARAYRGEQIGWIRLWVAIGSYISTLIPLVNLLAIPVFLVVFVWGIVDVFLLRSTRTDADGAALTTTPRDDKYAKGFYIYFIVSMILGIVGFIASIILIIVLIVTGAFVPDSDGATGNLPNISEQYR